MIMKTQSYRDILANSIEVESRKQQIEQHGISNFNTILSLEDEKLIEYQQLIEAVSAYSPLDILNNSQEENKSQEEVKNYDLQQIRFNLLKEARRIEEELKTEKNKYDERDNAVATYFMFFSCSDENLEFEEIMEKAKACANYSILDDIEAMARLYN